MFDNLKKSWTVWVNSIAFLGIAVESQLGYLKQVLTLEQYNWVILGIVVANILLRVKTEVQKQAQIEKAKGTD